MKQLHLVVFMKPQSKLRTQTVIVRGRRMTYTPAKGRDAQKELTRVIKPHKKAVEQFIGNREVPVYVEAIFYVKRPKHLPKRFILPVKNPDVDNYEKLLLDSIDKTLIPCDSQITTCLVKKRFGTPPRIEFILEVDVPNTFGKLPEVMLQSTMLATV